MKKIIDGKLYNTETAKLIAEHNNGKNRGDYNVIEEKLYLTRKGQWFHHIFGGANTLFAKMSKLFSAEGEKIVLLTQQEAINLLIDWDEDEIVLDMFPESIEEG